MITVNEIRRKAATVYPEVLKSSLTRSEFFPWIIRSNKQLSKDFVSMNRELASIIETSKERKGFGYSIKYESVNTRNHKHQDIPSAITFDSLDDYLKFTGKEKEHQQFQEDCRSILSEYPQMENWISVHTTRIIQYSGMWPDLLKVCRWFTNNFEKDRYYIRELPISVHTKFIEETKGILRLLLDELIPDKLLSSEKEFEKRFRLRYAQPLIRFRTLGKCEEAFQGIEDITVTLESFTKINLRCATVIVVENLMNFLTLPKLENAVAIWGQGFGLESMKGIEWMKSKRIFYWSDLDAHGMQMLSQLRSYFHQTQSMFMDLETLNRFKGYWVKGTPTKVTRLPHLTEDELKLFEYLSLSNIRLEQERIPQEFINEIVGAHVS
jgi:hypothetical protein